MNFETENIEFKAQFTEEIYKEVIAFANTDGGVVFVGIDNNGKPSDWQMWIRSIPASPTASAMLLCRTLQCSCAFRSRITGWCVLPSVREATSPTTSKEKV